MLEQFKFIGRKLFEEGLVGSHSGVLSIREGDKIIITRNHAMLSELRDEDLIETGMEGEVDKNAPSDISIHRAIYASRDIKAIVQAQPPYAMALSLHEEKIVPQDLEAKNSIKSIPVIRARESSGNEDVIRFLIPTFKSGYLCAMVRGLGSFAGAETLEEALRYTSVLERACKIVAIAKKGTEPQPQKRDERPRQQYRSAIPPSIGVMDRSYRRKR